MAQKTVCDVCGRAIDQQNDNEPFDFRNVRLDLTATMFSALEWSPADMCRYCMADAAASRDDRPKAAAEAPQVGCLKYFVHLNGIRCPGPHAAFHSEADAKKYLAGYAPGGEIRDR